MAADAGTLERGTNETGAAGTGSTDGGATGTADPADLVECLLFLGDDALVLGHRLSEWVGRAPTLEEDLSLPNMGLDLLGHARALYARAGELEGRGRNEDDFAYLRREREYRHCLLVERPNGDFAFTMVRQLLYSAYAAPWWHRARASTDHTVAGIAAKAAKELRYHVRHAGEWVIRLGDGTQESARRARAAIDALWPDVDELFHVGPALARCVAAGALPDPASAHPDFETTIRAVWAEAALGEPPALGTDAGRPARGRDGSHSEAFGHLLAALQYLPRGHPGARW